MMEQTRWLTPEETAAWLSLWSVCEWLPARLDEQVKREAGVNLLDYFALSQISLGDDQQLSMTHLANSCAVSPSRLSHVVKRLEIRGLVQRTPSPTDRRTNIAALTDAGREFLEKAAPGHVEKVRELVFDQLTEEEVTTFNSLLSKILRQISPPMYPRVTQLAAVTAKAQSGSLT